MKKCIIIFSIISLYLFMIYLISEDVLSLCLSILNLVIGIVTIIIIYKKSNYQKIETPKTNYIIRNLKNKEITKEQIKKTEPTKQYVTKPLLTDTEKKFSAVIKNCIPLGFYLKSQICLASIINKKYNNHYVNELFRIIDFGIFDKDYNIKALIEINDNTHHQKERQNRDYKVKKICEEANIPLITLWTEYGADYEYIQKRILNAIYQEEKQG